MLERCWVCLTAFITAAAATGCSTNDEQAFDCNVLPVCDILQRDCQERVYRASACAREQEPGSMPEVRMITAQQFGDELRAELAANATTGLTVWERAFQLLGLIPDSPLSEVVIESQVANVVAFYNSKDKRVSVVEDNTLDLRTASWILCHEFVHSLQDQDVDLEAWGSNWVHSTDESVAFHALVEGEAMVHPNVLDARRLGISPARVDWSAYSSDVLNSTLAIVEKAPSPFVDAIEALPYPLGFRFLIGRWLARGQAAIDELFETPLLSSVDWALASDSGAPGPADPLTCFPTAAPPGFVAFDHDSLGIAGVVGLEVALGVPASIALSDSTKLHDDSLVVFTNPADSSPAGVAAAWRLRFGDTFFANDLVNLIENRASLFASVLVEQTGQDVLVRAGDPVVLSAWTNAADCGRAEDLPVPSAGSAGMSALVRHGLRVRPRSEL